ncbi:hypothetical protein ADUPG1_004360 [Aduncisulcus paluster]|uniref:Uncharacterized protein n=1 Tax=Aduncisulcus paluster TaxID=2918883 RepID=A0ABQ5JWL1_9EUKA|nr:hypothetical protein ADUPG1_004360 [Aduncisulcus paluster]
MENGGQRENGERVEKGSPRGDMPLGEKPDFDNMTDEEKAAWEAEKEAEKVEREAERQAFQTAIEEGDTDTIKDHLDTMLERMEDHLENIEAKIAEFNSAE